MLFDMNKSKDTSNQSGDLERARRASGKSPESADPPDPEVKVKAKRRQFTRDYKLSILEQADRCSGSGEIGALLRREGLYSSHLTTWRRARRRGMLDGLSDQKRGPKTAANTAQTKEIAHLQKRIRQLEGELTKAHTIIDVQKKLSVLLSQIDNDEN